VLGITGGSNVRLHETPVALLGYLGVTESVALGGSSSGLALGPGLALYTRVPAQQGREERTMSILWAIIIGLVVGALAKLFMPGRDPGGILITIAIGIAGSIVAGWVGRALGLYGANDQGPGFIASVLGAMLLLLVYRLVVRRTRTV
jgi:uncharacterized membrane protein YeaQ/YmgE (transglycosylase-associated protein family)